MENVPPFSTSTAPCTTESRKVSFAPSCTRIFTLLRISMFTSVRLQPFGKTSIWVCMVPS